MYDYTSPANLCRWAEQQLNRKTIYQLGGIGRYDSSGRRVFDCVGLIKCFLWHDYGPHNTSYYGKTCPDINADQMYARATDKGRSARSQRSRGCWSGSQVTSGSTSVAVRLSRPQLSAGDPLAAASSSHNLSTSPRRCTADRGHTGSGVLF